MVMSSLSGRGGIFISYRREDTAYPAGRLYDVFCDHFGQERVFMDVDSLNVGVDFVNSIIEAVSRCDILLALIGREWVTITNSQGERRLNNPHDFVRVEIETALQREIPVMPILFDGAVMPAADDLPPSLQPLTRRNAIEISHTGFRSEVTRLVAAVDEAAKFQLLAPSGKVVLRKETRIRAPGVDLFALAEALHSWYETQGLEGTRVAVPAGLMVQCRSRGRLKHASRIGALTVILHDEGEDLLVDIGISPWWPQSREERQNAMYGGAGLALGVWAVSSPASISAVPIAAIAGGSAAVWRYRRLANQTISFLREAAPMHVRST
jgi:hypothetical protein